MDLLGIVVAIACIVALAAAFIEDVIEIDRVTRNAGM